VQIRVNWCSSSCPLLTALSRSHATPRRHSLRLLTDRLTDGNLIKGPYSLGPYPFTDKFNMSPPPIPNLNRHLSLRSFLPFRVVPWSRSRDRSRGSLRWSFGLLCPLLLWSFCHHFHDFRVSAFPDFSFSQSLLVPRFSVSGCQSPVPEIQNPKSTGGLGTPLRWLWDGFGTSYGTAQIVNVCRTWDGGTPDLPPSPEKTTSSPLTPFS